MADIITRLKLESESYDSKIKRATQGLLQMEQECRKVGGTLAVLEKDQLDYVRSLGNMETVSRNARGQLSELTAAFTELSMQYKRLTDEEKKGDYGKALSSSLSQLKTRIQDTKGQLSEINGEINGGGGLTGALDQLAGKFGLNIHQLAGWGAAIAAAKVALDVAKDAFFASEATVDEWGRVMDANKSLYEGFLTSLNTGDISGYLSRMDDIVNAARSAYNELDRLGTLKTIQAPQISAQQTENERMRMMIQTRRYIAPVDGRAPAPGMKDGQLLTPAQIKTLEQQLQNGMNTVVGLIGDEVKQTTAAIDAVYKRQGAELGMSVKEFRKGTSSMSEFEKRLAGAEKYNEYEREHTNMQYSASVGHYVQKRDNTVNPFAQYKGWDVFRVDGDRYNELVKLILQRDQQAAQTYGMQSQAYRAINRAEGITTRSLLGGGSGGGISATTIATPQERATDKVAEAERIYAETLLKNSIRLEVGLDSTIDNKKKELSAQERLFDAYNDAYATYKDPAYKESSQQAAERIKQLAAEVKTLTDTQDAVKKAARELEAAQKKLADAQQKLADAQATGSATAIYKAQEEVNRQQEVVNRLQNPSLPVPAAPTGFEAYKQTVQAEIKFDQMQVDENTLHSLLQTALQNGLDNLTVDYSGLQERIAKGIDIPDSTWEALQEEINAKLKELGIEPIKIDFDTGDIGKEGKDMEKSWSAAARAIGSVGSALQSIEDPTAKVAGLVAQAIAQIAATFAASLKGTFTPWDWIAGAAAGTATMISTIAAIKSATKGGFAEGGIVPGNSFSGDNLRISDYGVNSGELILNRAQQDTIASALEQSDENALGGTPYVLGETIYIGLTNYLRRTGRGELITANR